jgi:hypothetical protein
VSLQLGKRVLVVLQKCPTRLLPLRRRNRFVEFRPSKFVRANATIKSVLRLTFGTVGALFLAQRLVSLPLAFASLLRLRPSIDV